MERRFLPVPDAAAVCGVPEAVVRRLAASGNIQRIFINGETWVDLTEALQVLGEISAQRGFLEV